MSSVLLLSSSLLLHVLEFSNHERDSASGLLHSIPTHTITAKLKTLCQQQTIVKQTQNTLKRKKLFKILRIETHILFNLHTQYGLTGEYKAQGLRRTTKRISRKLDPFLPYGPHTPPFTLLICMKVQDFWDFYVHLVRPNDLPNTSDYHLFKDGIKPMWEVTSFSSYHT
jgi:hypothetical protein